MLQAIIDHLERFLGPEPDLHAGDDTHALDEEDEEQD
jgi:hypothetical protein